MKQRSAQIGQSTKTRNQNLSLLLFALPALGLRLWAKQWRHLRRSQLILWPLAAALVYFTVYQAAVQQPVQARCGAENDFSATVCAWPAYAA